jgi:hypothetical protein
MDQHQRERPRMVQRMVLQVRRRKNIDGHVNGTIVQKGLRLDATQCARHITKNFNSVSAITIRNKERRTSQASVSQHNERWQERNHVFKNTSRHNERWRERNQVFENTSQHNKRQRELRLRTMQQCYMMCLTHQ